MGIDRIGKGGAPQPAPETHGTEKKGPIEKAFSVEAPEAARPTAATGAVSAASPLGRLRAGEIDVNGYVDLKVDDATKGLEGLSPAELSDVKAMLRDQMASDPGLTDLVRTATGQIPSPLED